MACDGGEESDPWEATPQILQDLKDLLLTAWYQIPQLTVRGLLKSIGPHIHTYIQYIHTHTVHTQVRGCYACITTVAHLNFA